MRLILALSLCAASPAVAYYDISCQFDQECIEGEDCTATDFGLTLAVAADPADIAGADTQQMSLQTRMITDAETIEGSYSVVFPLDGLAGTFEGTTAGATHDIGILADGAAHYRTVLVEAELTIAYSGICTAAPA